MQKSQFIQCTSPVQIIYCIWMVLCKDTPLGCSPPPWPAASENPLSRNVLQHFLWEGGKIKGRETMKEIRGTAVKDVAMDFFLKYA